MASESVAERVEQTTTACASVAVLRSAILHRVAGIIALSADRGRVTLDLSEAKSSECLLSVPCSSVFWIAHCFRDGQSLSSNDATVRRVPLFPTGLSPAQKRNLLRPLNKCCVPLAHAAPRAAGLL
jgi:hypothetical protein